MTLIVPADGTPTQLEVLHPVGLGLDEAAIKAVSHYTFNPALKDGRPVAVRINVAVNFQIF